MCLRLLERDSSSGSCAKAVTGPESPGKRIGPAYADCRNEWHHVTLPTTILCVQQFYPTPSHLGQSSFLSCPDSNRVYLPPGLVFNWPAVAHSALVILDRRSCAAIQGQQCGSTGSTGGIHASHSLQRARVGGCGGGGIIKNGKEAKKDVVEELVTRIADKSSFRANLRPTELPSPCE